jgi:hypothetical protein
MTEAEQIVSGEAVEPHLMAKRLARRWRAGRDAISERYARFYAPLAIGALVLAFLPPFEDVDVNEGSYVRHVSYGTLFEMAGRAAGDPALIALILLAVLVVLLTVAAFRARVVVLPVGVAALAALLALMLLTKPGTGRPSPPLSEAGVSGLVVALCIMAIAVAHAIHLNLARPLPEYGPDV